MISMTRLLFDILQLNRQSVLDMSRLLILFSSYSTKHNNYIVGTAKVAKLDFLVRYPTALAKAFQIEGRSIKTIQIKDFENDLVESAMIRYRFGPWDHGYWSVLSSLESLNLIQIAKINGVTCYKITKMGETVVSKIANYPIFDDYFRRSKLVVSTFGKLTATKLVKKTYNLRPELASMRLGEEIRP